jgi:hypothetical protein
MIPTAAVRPARRLAPAYGLIGLVVVALLVPLAIRLVPGGGGPEHLAYLPALEGRREGPFHAHRIPELQRMNPGAVVIGDSMAGTRIDERLLGDLSGVPVAPLLQAGSGSAFWYLAMKNWVIASGIEPRVVFIFFRDTNLTDVLFRLDSPFAWALDSVATDTVETELDAVVRAAREGRWFAVHDLTEQVYAAEPVRRRLEPALLRAPATWMTSSRRGQTELLKRANERFGLDHLRVMETADMAEDAGTDFDDAVERSVLPLMLRDAARAGFTLCLVRVQRRPLDGHPPRQPPALRDYVSNLRAYVEARGAVFHDDTGDPDLTLDMYEDGDHIARQARGGYTRFFHQRLGRLFDARSAPR